MSEATKPKPNLMGSTRALIVQSEMTMTMDEAMKLINSRHAQRPFEPAQLYVFRVVPSTQSLDMYLTRMARTSLENYAADFSDGRALMNSHRTGGWDGSAELPIGRFFASDLTGDFLPEDAGFDAKGGAMLGAYAYIQRGLQITDVANDQIIEGIEGGTIRDISIGFLLVPDGMYKCSICGNDFRDYELCPHFPGVRYEDKRAFLWVENAHVSEASLVFDGATPGAMIDKAIRMSETGQLAMKDARMLEEQWGVRILPARTFGVIQPKDRGQIGAGLLTVDYPPSDEALVNWAVGQLGQKPATDQEEKGSEGAMGFDFEKFLESLRAADAGLAERLAGAPEAERATLLISSYVERRDEAARLTGEANGLKARAALGDQWIADLVEQAVRARVRAEGDKFDAERYRKLLKSNADPDFIKEEIASWERASFAIFGDGKRPTAGAQQAEAETPVPARMFKG